MPPASDGIGAPLLSVESESETKTGRLGFIAGTILEDKKMSFERILFRATRGNMFLKVVCSIACNEKPHISTFLSLSVLWTKLMKVQQYQSELIQMSMRINNKLLQTS